MQFLLAITFLLASMPIGSNSGESHIYTENRSDAYVWVTVYDRETAFSVKQAGAWCVAPGAFDKHGLRTIVVHERFEFSRDRCQGHILLDATANVGKWGQVTYKTSGSDGRYHFEVIAGTLR